jgi:hypothetical protein
MEGVKKEEKVLHEVALLEVRLMQQSTLEELAKYKSWDHNHKKCSFTPVGYCQRTFHCFSG